MFIFSFLEMSVISFLETGLVGPSILVVGSILPSSIHTLVVQVISLSLAPVKQSLEAREGCRTEVL